MDAYIGRLLDNRYEILEVIGMGGMAVVYKALDHRLNRMVAVKILKDELSRNQEFRRRFHTESQAVAMVSHPNIVGVFDVSRTGESDYIVMELIEGITLKQYLEKKGNLNWRETLHFSMQIAKALEHAHGKGIVHRDIKPHNIMILKDGSIKVADFGIARVGSAQNTLTREALGSVHYISPEQAKGARVDNRSDLYSLGVVMYEMLTGVTPYDGESPVAVAIQHINGAARCPSEIVTGIPLGLEQITMHAMNANPDTRYVSATDMLRDMEEFRKTPAITFRFNVCAAGAASVVSAKTAKTEAERYAEKSSKSGNAGAEHRRTGGGKQTEEQRSKNLTVAIIAAAVVLVVLLFVILFLVVFQDEPDSTDKDRTSTQSMLAEEIETPRFVGMLYSELDAAQYPDLVIEYDGLDAIAQEDLSDAKITRQYPEAGKMTPKGSTVVLTVSAGNKMPDYTDMTEAELIAYLNDLKLGLQITTKKDFDDEVEKDRIISTDPAIGSALEKNQEITIYVSLGSNKMPDLIGMNKDVAMALLEELQKEIDFEIRWEEENNNEIEAGAIIETDPQEGELIRSGKTVTIIVSLGNNAMPDLAGKTKDEAIGALNDMNLSLNIVIEYEMSDSVPEGEVVRTDPAAGTDLVGKQSVTIYVSSGDGKIEVPSVLGLSASDARTALEDLGFVVIVREYYDEDVPAGCVISQSEAPQSRVSQGATITIDVSMGPQPTENTDPTEITEPTENAEP